MCYLSESRWWFQCVDYNYTACIDYMDPDVRCPKKVKLNHPLTHSPYRIILSVLSVYRLVFFFDSHIPAHTPVCIIFSCYQWSNRSLSSILLLNRYLHSNTCRFYPTTLLYMFDSWCIMYHLYSILFTFLGPVSFFIYGHLFPKDIMISFYQCHVCMIILVIWIPCVNSVVLIGIFTAYPRVSGYRHHKKTYLVNSFV